MPRIWIIEDNAAFRRGTERALTMKPHAHDVRAFTSCEDAIEAMNSTTLPDVILLDWNMPVMNGIEFLRELRAAPGGDTPKVVFCTTENDLAHIMEAMGSGADEYIMKPFDAEIIESKFSQVGIL